MKRMLASFGFAVLAATGVFAQDHAHLPAASGVPHGIPRICTAITATSAASGAWSNPATWSPQRVPGAGDGVLIKSGTIVTYDAVSDAAVTCIDVDGTLTFRTDANTRLTVGTLTVLEAGRLEIGTEQRPVAAGVTAASTSSSGVPTSSAPSAMTTR